MRDAATCDDVLDLVEPIAAGEQTPGGPIAAHLAGCPACAAAVERARRLERLLQTRPAPAAPARFTSRTMARLGRQRWRSEQVFDAVFNVALALAAVAVAGTVLVIISRAGLAPFGSAGGVDLVRAGFVSLARRVAPSVPVYAGATALLATSLGIWWWTERGLMR